jgi:hypothetical protein
MNHQILYHNYHKKALNSNKNTKIKNKINKNKIMKTKIKIIFFNKIINS